jgi:hypothetical protein
VSIEVDTVWYGPWKLSKSPHGTRKLVRYATNEGCRNQGMEYLWEEGGAGAREEFRVKLELIRTQYHPSPERPIPEYGAAIPAVAKSTTQKTTEFFVRTSDSPSTEWGPIDSEHDAKLIVMLLDSFVTPEMPYDPGWQAYIRTTTVKETIL